MLWSICVGWWHPFVECVLCKWYRFTGNVQSVRSDYHHSSHQEPKQAFQLTANNHSVTVFAFSCSDIHVTYISHSCSEKSASKIWAKKLKKKKKNSQGREVGKVVEKVMLIRF